MVHLPLVGLVLILMAQPSLAELKQQARAVEAKGDGDAALAAWQRAMAADTRDPGVRLELARLYGARGDRPHAIEHMLSAGAEFERQGFLMKAFALFRSAAASYPESRELSAARDRTEATLRRGVDDGAVVVDRRPERSPGSPFESFRKLADAHPENRKYRELLIKKLRDDGREDEAREEEAKLANMPAGK